MLGDFDSIGRADVFAPDTLTFEDESRFGFDNTETGNTGSGGEREALVSTLSRLDFWEC